MSQRDSFEVVGPVTRLVQAGGVHSLVLRRPQLGEEIEPPANRHDHERLPLGQHPRVLPALTIQANFVPDRFHRKRHLVRDLHSARQVREGEGRAIIISRV